MSPVFALSLPRKLWIGYLALTLVATVGYFVLPGGGPAQAVVLFIVNAVELLAIVSGSLWLRPSPARFWNVLAAAQGIYLAAYAIWYLYPVVLHGMLPFPSVADAFFIGSYALSAVALLLLMRSRGSAAHSRADLLDAAIITLGIASISWVYLIAPDLRNTQLDIPGRLVSIAYPLMDIVLISFAVRLAVTPGARTPAHWLLIGWIVCQFAADSAYAVDLLQDGLFTYGSPYFAGWLLSFVFLGAAALHPSMRDLGRAAAPSDLVAPRRRLALLVGASLIPLALMLLDREQDDMVVLAIFSGLLFILAALRMSDLMVDIVEHRRLKADLQRSNAELEQFAYIASHDLQEPLRMVASYTGLLKRRYAGRLDSDADEFIEYAQDGANRMQALINDLLSYSRVGRQERSLEASDAGAALQRALDNLRPAIEERQALVTQAPMPAVLGDPGQLTQLFQNLVGNALKFSIDRPEIEIGAERAGGVWRFHVRDNGIGIDPQYQERIFLIFQRLHRREDYPGTGIGLAICKKIVEHHGGRIWVESAAGRGATFYFTLRAAEGSKGTQPTEARRAA